ncbi:MAG: antibiotic biosynthesis monooxygenase family protein [Actinomycetota bacterium]
MIARMWRGWTAADREDEYVDYLNRTGVRDLRATAGNRGVYVLHRPVEDERAEFVVLSLWDSRDAIVAFAGEDIEVARFYPEDDEFLVQREWRCAHYDVAVAP